MYLVSLASTMFVIILTISILTAFVQIISSFSELKKPGTLGIGGVTRAGWTFYICTIVLAVLPAIQKLMQDSSDEKKEKEIASAQDVRDEKLRIRYDSALGIMKSKFDTTTNIISETLGKYGFKLDSTNLVLIDLRDSISTKSVYYTDNPVLELASPEKGIVYDGKTQDGKSKFVITMQSSDAASSFYNIKYSFGIRRDGKIEYIPLSNPVVIEGTIAKNGTSTHVLEFWNIDNYTALLVWIRGTYKSTTGTNVFSINNVYEYDAQNKITGLRTGSVKKEVIDFFIKKEK